MGLLLWLSIFSEILVVLVYWHSQQKIDCFTTELTKGLLNCCKLNYIDEHMSVRVFLYHTKKYALIVSVYHLNFMAIKFFMKAYVSRQIVQPAFSDAYE